MGTTIIGQTGLIIKTNSFVDNVKHVGNSIKHTFSQKKKGLDLKRTNEFYTLRKYTK